MFIHVIQNSKKKIEPDLNQEIFNKEEKNYTDFAIDHALTYGFLINVILRENNGHSYYNKEKIIKNKRKEEK